MLHPGAVVAHARAGGAGTAAGGALPAPARAHACEHTPAHTTPPLPASPSTPVTSVASAPSRCPRHPALMHPKIILLQPFLFRSIICSSVSTRTRLSSMLFFSLAHYKQIFFFSSP